MKIIFLDIDGVLNCQNFLINRYQEVIKFNSNCNIKNEKLKHTKIQLMDIDYKKLRLLKEIIDITNSKIVIISSWKSLVTFSYIKQILIALGIPIIDVTNDNLFNRGEGIKRYLLENEITNYIIIDDEIFDDYDEILLSRLIKTNFYEEGLTEEHKNKAIKLLKKHI